MNDGEPQTLAVRKLVWVSSAILLCAFFVARQTDAAAGDSQAEGKAGAKNSGRQDTKERLILLRAAVQRAPQSAEAHNELGLALGEAGDLNAAIEELALATQLDSSYSAAHYNLGVTYVKRAKLARGRDEAAYYHDLDSALQAFRSANRLAPNLPRIHEQLGWLDQEIGDSSAAVEEFRQAVQENPRSAEACDSLGTALARTRQFDDAIRAYERAMELDVHYVPAELSLESVVQQRSTNSSILEARRAVTLHQPNSAIAHALLGHALSFNDRASEATVELRKAIVLDPDLPIAHYFLGQALQQVGDFQGSVEELTAALKRSPQTFEFRIELGLALLKQNKLNESLALLQAAVEQNPSDPSAHYSLARALEKAGHREDAAKEFRQTNDLGQAERDRQEAALFTMNGIDSLRAGKINEAVESLRKAVARKPGNAEANYYLGIALAQAGDKDGSIQAFRMALAKRPDSAEIHYNFGIALRQMGKSPEAVQELRQSIQLRPDDGLAHCALGKILLQAGEDQAGEKELERAHQLGACNPTAAPTPQ
jgi:tetratricopeptide (TPR) repeat protein